MAADDTQNEQTMGARLLELARTSGLHVYLTRNGIRAVGPRCHGELVECLWDYAAEVRDALKLKPNPRPDLNVGGGDHDVPFRFLDEDTRFAEKLVWLRTQYASRPVEDRPEAPTPTPITASVDGDTRWDSMHLPFKPGDGEGEAATFLGLDYLVMKQGPDGRFEIDQVVPVTGASFSPGIPVSTRMSFEIDGEGNWRLVAGQE